MSTSTASPQNAEVQRPRADIAAAATPAAAPVATQADFWAWFQSTPPAFQERHYHTAYLAMHDDCKQTQSALRRQATP